MGSDDRERTVPSGFRDGNNPHNKQSPSEKESKHAAVMKRFMKQHFWRTGVTHEGEDFLALARDSVTDV